MTRSIKFILCFWIGAPGLAAGDLAEDEYHVWSTPAGCEAVLARGQRLPGSVDKIRLVSWNLRWFPEGSLNPDSPRKTDLGWAACAISWMNADVVALQGIRDHEAARSSMQDLIRDIEKRTASTWRVSLQECGNPYSQHVGLLWNADAVDISELADAWRFNANSNSAASPCKGNLRPGRYGRLKSRKGGLDFHLVSIQGDAGTLKEDYDNRFEIIKEFGQSVDEFAETDVDVVVIGSFNTMGTSEVEAELETSRFRTQISRQQGAYRVFPAAPHCSQYRDGNAALLDHAVLPENMKEAEGSEVRVSGYCVVSNCDPLSPFDMPLAYHRLSDHCPVYVDFADRDDD